MAIKPKGKKSDKEKAATAAEDNPETKSADPIKPQEQPSSSKGLRSANPKFIKKRITRDTSPSTILNAFQKQDVVPEEWESLADQVLTRGLQKTAQEKLNAKDTLAEEHVTGGNSSPPAFSDESIIDEQSETTIRRSKRATTNQGPKRFGSPVKHSVKEISADEDLADLNEMA